MADSLPLEIASTIQSASINRHPDTDYDLNPSTSASAKQPVTISRTRSHISDEDEYGIDGDSENDQDEEDIPYSVIRPLPRRPEMPPLPDLRFEQSYLASIAHADTNWKIAWITTRDQVFLLSLLTIHQYNLTNFLSHQTAYAPPYSRHTLVPPPTRLAPLEPPRQPLWEHHRLASSPLVVQNQQLGITPHEDNEK